MGRPGAQPGAVAGLLPSPSWGSDRQSQSAGEDGYRGHRRRQLDGVDVQAQAFVVSQEEFGYGFNGPLCAGGHRRATQVGRSPERYRAARDSHRIRPGVRGYHAQHVYGPRSGGPAHPALGRCDERRRHGRDQPVAGHLHPRRVRRDAGHGARHGRDGATAGSEHRQHNLHPDRDRLRTGTELPLPGGGVPLDRGADQGHPDEPAVGRGGVWSAGRWFSRSGAG